MAETKEKRVCTQEDKDRIMRDAPDYILESTDMIKDLYLASEWAKEKRDLSEERYFTLLINEGLDDERTIEIDFQQTVNVSAYVKTHGGDLEAVRKANGKRLAYLRLDRAYQNAVLELNKALGKKTHRARNIVDYTGTILELFGKFYTVNDVAKVMGKEYRIKIPEEELKKFYVDNRDLISRRRAEYILQNKDFRIATETGRLEVLNKLLIDAELKNKAQGGGNTELANLIIRIIEQARKEVKGNEIKMTVDGRIDINATLHAEGNINSAMAQLSVNALVIGLTAAKAGLNPAVLIGQLANSWYKQFNGFNGNVIDGTTVELPSALIRSYDWGKIETASQKFIDEFTPITDVTEEKEEAKAMTAEERRKQMLQRLKAIKEAKRVEDERANPVTPDDTGLNVLTEGVVLQPTDPTVEEPTGEFPIDYNLNKKYRQQKGMYIKGAIGESIARHKQAKEEGEVNILKDEARRKKEAARQRKMRREKKKREQEEKKKGKKPEDSEE